MTENPLLLKTEAFAVRSVKLYNYLTEKKHEYQISVQIKRSGTSIGANATEAQFAQSKKDFLSKMSIALKECSETQFWLRVLNKSGILTESEFNSIYPESEEIGRMLASIVIKTKRNLENANNNNKKSE